MSKKRHTKDVYKRLDEASALIAVTLRETVKKYGNFVDELTKVQRAVENVRSAHQSLFRAVDGSVREIATYCDAGVTPPNSFVGELYSAITNTSIRRWTREHVDIVRKTVSEKASVERKIAKLRDRASLEKPGTPEAAATAALLVRQCNVRDALASRIDFTLRKFLELRQCALKTLVGTTETIYNLIGDNSAASIIEGFPTSSITQELESADYLAVKSRKRKLGKL